MSPPVKPFTGWPKCVAAVGPEQIKELSNWRRISADYIGWLITEKLIGLYRGCWATPVFFSNRIVAVHYRVEPGKDGKADWFYEPKIRDELGIGIQPLIVGDLGRAETIYVYESQWDAFCIDDMFKFPDEVASFVTRGATNAGLCAQIAGPNIKKVLLIPQNDAAGRKWVLEAAAALNGKFPVRVVQIPAEFKDANDWTASGAERAQVLKAIQTAGKPPASVPKKKEAPAAPEPQSAARESVTLESAGKPPTGASTNLPLIQLPGEGRYVKEFAQEIGPIFAQRNLFNFHGLPMLWTAPSKVDDPQLVHVSAQMFRGLVETHIQPFARSKRGGGDYVSFKKTLSLDHAAATLAHPSFLEALPALSAINHVPLPVRRPDGAIELLTKGYDQKTGIFTVPGAIDYERDLPLAEAKKYFTDLLGEFCFTKDDRDRSQCVILAMMLSLFCRNLLSGQIQPGWIFSANSEGAGKTTAALLGLIPVLGNAPTGTIPRDEDEMRKLILATLLDARPILFLDNVTRHLASASLEALMTATTFQGRVLGLSKTVQIPNNVTIVITGNGATFSGSLRRRCFVVELFLEEARAETHKFKRSLEVNDIKKARPHILAALWSLIKNWTCAGQPKSAPADFNSTPSWSQLIGPILEGAGYCALQPSPKTLLVSGDRQLISMESLMAHMFCGADYPFNRLLEIIQEHELFEWLIKPDSDPDPAARSKLGWIFKRFNNQIFPGFDPPTNATQNFRFVIEQGNKNRQGKVFWKHKIQ